jgi:hypothetical protein
MGRRDTEELIRAFRRLLETTDTFVTRAPRQKRIEAERSALLDAITHAQLVLSVSRVSPLKPDEPSKTGRSRKNQTRLERQLQQSHDQVKQLELQLETMTAEREALADRVEMAKGLLESTAKPPARVIPFRRVR